MKLIDKGAEAYIYSGKMLGRDVIVKTRNPKNYRIKKLDIMIRKSRTRREAKAMYKASKAGVSLPGLFAVGKFSIYMEKIEGVLLKDAKTKSGIYAKLGTALSKLHNAEISHGDFTPANVMIKGNKIWIIDFGLADLSRSTEEKAIDLLLMKRSISKSNYQILKNNYQRKNSRAKEILARLDEIETRGRYNTRTLI